MNVYIPALMLFCSVSAAFAQAPPNTTPADPVLHGRVDKPAKPPDPNRMQLDVLVTDPAGKPVSGLEPWDFKLFDNDRPSKILYFRAFDGEAVKADPPVEVILLFDTINLGVQQQASVRDNLTQFLSQNGGQLEHPVTLMVLNDKGLEVQPQPSRDGNAIAALLKKVNPHITAFNPAMGIEGAMERFNRSVRQIRFIAENESHKPGRKLLIWTGIGWPLLETEKYIPSDSDKSKYFQSIAELSKWLGEAHMAVYSVAPIDSSTGASVRAPDLYQNFLKPVLIPHQAQSGSLALRVIAAQTGGQILGPSNDIAGQIRRCITDADGFYQLSFEAPLAQHADEYHSLRVSVSRAGVVVRTRTGYYDQPAQP